MQYNLTLICPIKWYSNKAANVNVNEKRSEETQTLHAGSSKAEPKIFTPLQTPFWGRRMAKT